jgi:hypothetical protein
MGYYFRAGMYGYERNLSIEDTLGTVNAVLYLRGVLIPEVIIE